jgi:hypothetical protein
MGKTTVETDTNANTYNGVKNQKARTLNNSNWKLGGVEKPVNRTDQRNTNRYHVRHPLQSCTSKTGRYSKFLMFRLQFFSRVYLKVPRYQLETVKLGLNRQEFFKHQQFLNRLFFVFVLVASHQSIDNII